MNKVKVVYNCCFGGFGLSDTAIEYLVEHGINEDDIWELPRHHPLLVKCVEELGDKADGSCASLDIKEINGFQYRISEYDGSESVIEPDETDWVYVNPEDYK